MSLLIPDCGESSHVTTTSQKFENSFYTLTGIDHYAHHCLCVANGTAPQQKVAVLEADTNSTAVLSVGGKKTHIQLGL